MEKIFKFLIFILFISFIKSASAQDVLSWQDCLKEAARNHPDLISAQEAVKESEADKRITKSGIFPQIDSSLSGSTAESGGATTDTYTYGVSVTQLLFDGAKTNADLKAAAETIKASEHNYRFTSSEVRFRLRSAFIDLLKVQELLKITDDIYHIRRGNLELITLRYESGLEHKGALLNAQANLAQAEFEISQAKRDMEVAQRRLLKEMGRVEFAELRVDGDFDVSDRVIEAPDFQTLALTNPYLGRLIAQKNAAGFDIKSAYANFLPELSASAGANKSSAKWPPGDERWNAGLTLSLPLFEGGLKLAQVEKAQAEYNQAMENERSAKDDIIVSLQEAWASLQDAVETVEVKDKFLRAAEERSRIAEAQYSLGMIQFDNWTIIEDDLVDAKKALITAQADALLTEASWIQAKGETLEHAQK